MGKVIDIKTGNDITPVPLTPEDLLKEEFTKNIVELFNTVPLDVAIDSIFYKYSIKKHDTNYK